MKQSDIRAAYEKARTILRGRRVLTDYEKTILRRVKTTAEEAEMILERNAPLLQQLEKGLNKSGTVGCPHCIHFDYCEEQTDGMDIRKPRPKRRCNWRVEPFVRRAKKEGTTACCTATFGGVCLDDAREIIYGDSYERVLPINGTYNDKKIRTDSLTFLIGHIEWAMLVLRKNLRKKRA